MSKKIAFEGIEILIPESDESAKSLFNFTEEVINLLENELDNTDQNFHLNISVEYFSERKPKISIVLNNSLNQKTRIKICEVLGDASGILSGNSRGTASINLHYS